MMLKVKDKINPHIIIDELPASKTYGWYLFDFANSILIINGSLYFPQWIVGKENNVSDLWFNLIFVLSSVVLLILGPILGHFADQKNLRFRFLVYSSTIIIISGLAVGLAPIIANQNTRVLFSLVSFFFVLFSYQLSLVFYNSLLGSVSKRENYAQVSGRALAWGWIGGIVAIFFGLLFIKGYLPSIGISGGIGMNSILPSALLSSVLTVISLILISKNESVYEKNSSDEIYQFRTYSFWQELRSLLKNKTIWFFLLGYLFFSDAILTLQNNSTIYMDAVLKFSDDIKGYQFIIVLMTGAIGALISSPLVKLFGLKQALFWILVVWAVVVALSAFTTEPISFTIFFALIGFLNGAVWNVARVLFFLLIPIDRRCTYFGVYSSLERFASILGPLLWGVSVSMLTSLGDQKYQIAWFSMSLFLLLGCIFIKKMPGGKYEHP